MRNSNVAIQGCASSYYSEHFIVDTSFYPTVAAPSYGARSGSIRCCSYIENRAHLSSNSCSA